MTHKRTAILSVLVAVACAVGLIAAGCEPQSVPVAKTTVPDASVTDVPQTQPPHNLGLPVNNTFEVGSMVAEMGFTEWTKTAADLSSTQDAGTAETAIGIIGPGPSNIEIGAVQYNPAAALTASDTQNAIIKVFKRNAPDGGGGTTQTLLASASTFTPGKDGGTGNWNPWTPVSFTVVAGAFVSPADTITVSITKNGTTGVSVPQGQLMLFTTIR